MPGHQLRVDSLGRAYAGSQLQVQTYVNRRLERLNSAILESLPSLATLSPVLEWVSPLERDRFAEYQDEAFLRALGLQRLQPALRRFWPEGGPVWDGLAVVKPSSPTGANGVLLLEGKSYPSEIYGPGCRAEGVSLAQIGASLDRTKKWLAVAAPTDWLGPLYQSANRLSHLHFFREVAGVSAWLANVCFLDDPIEPTGFHRWQEALREVHRELGLEGAASPYVSHVFLEAATRDELLR